ncbi:hypothetical protein QBC37DRAFT_408480 [Rhypophila decipiens]|uniref:Protein kinase domain-containing protein n=1 Tax=Rhypophila decipiens TaxID=261697 RepID=A0AAN7BDW6_9PEZI|nr:hypothetical protein QBC37DRAFT_408480 [Rhypophila decipiens]
MATNSQGWDSRFNDDEPGDQASSRVPAKVSNEKFKQDELLLDTLIALRHELLFIPPQCLEYFSLLGRGSSFEVNKELLRPTTGDPHFVAVKRILTHDDGNKLRTFTSVSREVRVLTHSKLRSHGCLVSAIGYGWTSQNDRRAGPSQPYLVMQYSDRGSLKAFARHNSVTLYERHLLALDVAMGLRALHESDIVHCDVKPDNVLVYDPPHQYIGSHNRSFVAKVADFGNALFRKDFERQEQKYLGTQLYLAPEMCGRFRQRDSALDHDTQMPKFEQFKAADCYSFGILLWETVNNGEPFINPQWLATGKDASLKERMDFLEQLFHNKSNALLEIALQFFTPATQSVDSESDIKATEMKWGKQRGVNYVENPTFLQLSTYVNHYPHLQGQLEGLGEGNSSQEQSFEVFRVTACLCLQDSALKRGTMSDIVKTLARDIGEHIPHGGLPTVRLLPHDRLLNNTVPKEPGYSGHLAGHERQWLMAPTVQLSATLRGLALHQEPQPEPQGAWQVLSKNNLRAVSLTEPSDPALQVARVEAPKQMEYMVLTPQEYRYKGEDMFRASKSAQPPWQNQCEAAEALQRAIGNEKDPEEKAQAHLQLAIMHHIGYGVAPDRSQVLHHLEQAAHGNEVARSIWTAVSDSLGPEQMGQTRPAVPTHTAVCKDPMIFSDDTIIRGVQDDDSGSGSSLYTVGPISVGSITTFRILVNRGRYEASEICEALTVACRDGNVEAAVILARHCSDFSSLKADVPNPLHWLVTLTQEGAMEVLRALVEGKEGCNRVDRLNALRPMLASGLDSLTVFLPPRCVELRGTPLHWAATCGYAELVSEFIKLDANVNTRTKWRRESHALPNVDHEPGLSPLDCAAALHHSQIVKILLEHGAESYGGDWYWSHSPFHMLGFKAFPFARYVAHGHGHRAALRATIRVLLQQNIDINRVDSLNETPLYLAVKNIDLEPYILEELLSAGAQPGEECDKMDGNILCAAIICCDQRRFSHSKVPLLIPSCKDRINSATEHQNALHLCSVFDATTVVETLLQTPGVDINAHNKHGMTALDIAASRGSLNVLAILIKNSALEHHAQQANYEVIPRAIGKGQTEAVKMLIEAAGAAALSFTKINADADVLTRNILHVSVSTDGVAPSYVSHFLDTCPRLREPEYLDQFSSLGRTPLHEAAYYGDHNAVHALLAAGANPLARGVSFGLFAGTPKELAVKIKGWKAELKLDLHPRIQNGHRFRLGDTGHWSAGTMTKALHLESLFMDCLEEVIRTLEEAERKQVQG